MLDPGDQLAAVLKRMLGPAKAGAALDEAWRDLGLPDEEYASPVCAAYALMQLNVQADEVSRGLSWREFERLAGALLRASGYQVRQDVHLRKPRAQIDVVATGPSMVLSVDCKHYHREQGPSALQKAAEAQLRRGSLLRKTTSDPRPIASVILSMSHSEGRFVKGVALVPIRTLRSFLNSLDSYAGELDLR